MSLIGWHSQGETHLPGSSEWLTPPEAARLAAMPYTKRREESRLGRWTAKSATALALGWTPTPEALRRISIRNAADGAPEVFIDDRPVTQRISMTDRAGWAVTIVSEGMEVGCDLELVEPRSAAFVRDYLTASERDLVAAAPEPDLMANLVWSAKESALKVLRTGLRRDTRSVEVRLDPDESDGWRRLTVRPIEGGTFPGWWRRYGDFILTIASVGEHVPPPPFTRPEPLASAHPAHSWMGRPREGPS